MEKIVLLVCLLAMVMGSMSAPHTSSATEVESIEDLSSMLAAASSSSSQLEEDFEGNRELRRKKKKHHHKPKSKTLTADQKVKILYWFNQARRTVNPNATGMPLLEWDEGIAQEVQAYINSYNCNANWPYVGAYPTYPDAINLYRDLADDPLVVARIRSYEQGQYYDYNTNDCRAGTVLGGTKGCKHIEIYVKIVSDNVRQVGCAMYNCGKRGTWHSCAYRAQGSTPPDKPYATGGPFCSACPIDIPDCKNKLCWSNPNATST